MGMSAGDRINDAVVGPQPSVTLVGRRSMRVSVIVSNFNGSRYLPRLLATLRGQHGVETEVIVVDRHSTDESAAILAASPEVRVVKEAPESGLVTGYAVGAEHASHDLLFFCNEDMWFDLDCLERLAARIDLVGRVAAADPWQWTYDGKDLVHAGTRFRPCGLDPDSPYPYRHCDFTRPLAAGEVVPFGCAGAVMIHRKVYQELGGWDRGFFLDYEDVDFFLRAWQAGWKCVTVPEAKVYHAVNASNDKVISGGRQRVSRRRLISARSNLLILGVKYFSLRYAVVLALVWAARMASHVAMLNVTTAWWYLLAGREALQRFAPAVAFRQAKRRVLRARPGEAFFRAPEFQA
jgi:GT2 family glycosyltransferase